MNVAPKCLDCLYIKTLKRAENKSNLPFFSNYKKELYDIIYGGNNNYCTSILVYRINNLYEKYFGKAETFKGINDRYNSFMLEREGIIEEKIRKSSDIIESAIKFACAGNYIDFGTNPNVSEDVLSTLLTNAKNQNIESSEIEFFKNDLKKSNNILYVLDNCGEIIIDKIFIKIIKELYPNKHITAMVRGGEVLNDVMLKDAINVGLINIVNVIDNGYPTPGLVPSMCSEIALNALKQADLIIAKGQGNFEALYGENYNPYFMFLCKCELFNEKFNLKMFEPVFRKEERINVKFI